MKFTFGNVHVFTIAFLTVTIVVYGYLMNVFLQRNWWWVLLLVVYIMYFFFVSYNDRKKDYAEIFTKKESTFFWK